MKTMYEILQIILERFEKAVDSWTSSYFLCNIADDCEEEGLLNKDDVTNFKLYITRQEDNCSHIIRVDDGSILTAVAWEFGNIRDRRAWLKKHINKLTSDK